MRERERGPVDKDLIFSVGVINKERTWPKSEERERKWRVRHKARETEQ